MEKEIELARSAKGGWSKKQLQEWGVAWPPKRGWKEELISKYNTQKSIEAFIKGIK